MSVLSIGWTEAGFTRVEEAVSRFIGRYGRLVTITDTIATVDDEFGRPQFQERVGRTIAFEGMSDGRGAAVMQAIANKDFQQAVDLLNDEEIEEGDGAWQFN